MTVAFGENPNFLKEATEVDSLTGMDCKSCLECPDFIFKRGTIPVLIVASYAFCAKKVWEYPNQYIEHDIYLNQIAQLIHKFSGAHAIYTNKKLKFDPAIHNNSPFRRVLEKMINEYGIQVLIEIQGIPENMIDIEFGTGGVGRPFLRGKPWIYYMLAESFKKCGILKIGDNHLYTAKDKTLSRIINRETGLNVVKIDISRKLRRPDTNALELARTIKALSLSVSEIGRRINQGLNA